MIKEFFGKLDTDEVINKFTLSNKNLSISIIELGAAIQSLKFNGKEMVLGYDNLEDYLKGSDYFGAVVGRYANRIESGRFVLNGKEYTLYKNFGNSSLHGGKEGFNKKKWQAYAEEDKITFHYLSRDGEEGFPGNLIVKVIYHLLDDGIGIEYIATTDKNTVVNLSNHTYFNLSDCSEPVENQYLTLNAYYYTPIDKEFITTGDIRSVYNTPFDFIKPKLIGQDINMDDEQIHFADGYDHNFIINGEGFRQFAEVYSQMTGIAMIGYTDMPGVQVYSGNLLNDCIINQKKQIHKRYGLCLETQFFPNSVNRPMFPSSELKAGEIYRSRTEYRFRNKK